MKTSSASTTLLRVTSIFLLFNFVWGAFDYQAGYIETNSGANVHLSRNVGKCYELKGKLVKSLLC